MDLNELLSRHQIALIEMAHAPSPAWREWAEDRSDYYATCIASMRRRLGADQPLSKHRTMKRLMRG